VMNTLFPFGFPWPTAIYLTLYVVTATIYMIFMNYVLAGAIVLVVGYLAPGARRRVEATLGSQSRSGLGLIVTVVRDWLPAILGLAITTGIAPLLFLQILYKRHFYTANLLLFNRFMLLLPALIAAFLMLYLIKSRALSGKWSVWRGPVTIAALACFAYTTWAWTENHVLSIHEESWKHLYKGYNYFYRNAEIWPRLGYWLTASFATLAVVLAWQLHWSRRLHDPVNLDLATRRLRSLALLGLAMSATEAWLWQLWLDRPAQAVVLSRLAFPYGLMVIAGIIIQIVGWLPAKGGADLSTRRLMFISAGSIITIFGTLVVREARRLAAIDITILFDTHHRVVQVGGIGVFLFFFALNAAVIAACVLIVKRSL